MAEPDTTRPDAAPASPPTGESAVGSLAWMRDVAPPPAEEGAPAPLRVTPPSEDTSIDLRPDLSPSRPYHQAGVSPGNAEADEEDWEHPYGG
jgi:hypothetical protein